MPSLYSGRLVQQRDESWVMLGFLDRDGNGEFIGEIADPIPLDSLGITGDRMGVTSSINGPTTTVASPGHPLGVAPDLGGTARAPAYEGM